MQRKKDNQGVVARLAASVVPPVAAAAATALGWPVLPVAVPAALAAKMVDVLATRAGKPDLALATVGRAERERAFADVRTLKDALLAAAGLRPELRTHIQQLIEAQEDPRGDKERTLLVEAIQRLFREVGEAATPEELAARLPRDPFAPYWPSHSICPRSQEVSDKFCGRLDERCQLQEQVAASRSVVAVLGMAGQGKSSLLGQWWVDCRATLADRAIFWCRAYEADYDYPRFVDDLLGYLTAGRYDQTQVPSPEERSRLLCEALRAKPTLVVIDGLERWLNRWARDGDADAVGATEDDRAGHSPGLDHLLADASTWTKRSGILFTSRGLPSVLDGRPKFLVRSPNAPAGADGELGPMDAESAIELLRAHGVEGADDDIRRAANEYENHALALTVLGEVIRRLHGGDILQWPKVDVLDQDKKHRLDRLLDKVAARCKTEAPFLLGVAAFIGPAPIEALAGVLNRPEADIREAVATLADWRIVRFDGRAAEMHALVRQYFLGQADANTVREQRKAIALWFAARSIPPNPMAVTDLGDRARAVKHALACRETELAGALFIGPWHAQSPRSTYCDWLAAIGQSDACSQTLSTLVEQYGALVTAGRPDLRNDLANVYNNRGSARAALGQLKEAVEDYDKAVGIHHILVEAEGRKDLRNYLAGAYNNRALALLRIGQLKQAVEDCDKTVAMYRTLVEREGRRDQIKYLASSYNNRGLVRAALGQLKEAAEDYDKAVSICFILVEEEGRKHLRNDLAGAYTNRAFTRLLLGQLKEAVEDGDNAVATYRILVEQEGRRDLRRDLATAYNNRALARAGLGQLKEAVEDYDKAVPIRRTLVEEEGWQDLRNDLAGAHNNRGLARADLGQLKEAVEDFDKAVAIRQFQVEQEGRRDLRQDLANSYINRGMATTRLGQLKQALEDCEKAVAILSVLVEKEGRRDLREDLASAYANRGVARAQLGKPREALDDFEEAVAIRHMLVEEEGRNDLRNDLADTCNNRGLARLLLGQPKESVEDCDKAVAIYRILVEQEGRRELRNDLATAYINRGLARADLGHPREAVENYDKAVAIRYVLVEEEGRDDLRKDLASAYNNRGLARVRLGKIKDAVDDYNKALATRRILVEQGRRELTGDLAGSLFNRASAQEADGDLPAARQDMEHGAGLMLAEIQAGSYQFLPLLLTMASQLAALLLKMDDPKAAVGWVSRAADLVQGVVDRNAVWPALRQELASFYGVLLNHLNALVGAGMDVERFLRSGIALALITKIDGTGQGQPPDSKPPR